MYGHWLLGSSSIPACAPAIASSNRLAKASTNASKDRPLSDKGSRSTADRQHLSNLFATDVLFRGGRGQVLKGRAAVKALFDQLLGSGGPTLGVGRVVADDRRVAFELIRLGGPCNEEDPATALDFMEINEDGQVVSFTAFLRPRPQ